MHIINDLEEQGKRHLGGDLTSVFINIFRASSKVKPVHFISQCSQNN